MASAESGSVSDSSSLVPKWEGMSTVEIKSLTADKIWPFLSDDFCDLHKWLPTIDTCHRIDGNPGEPGLTRHCANSSSSTWANEKLLTIDNDKMCLSYEVLDNTVGFHNYVATFQVSPLLSGGCEMKWSFVSDPADADGWKLEDLRSYIDSALHAMAANMEAALK